jgi:RimJ/RimL family protein N-acetyltransferase
MRVQRIYNGDLLKELLMKAPKVIEDNDDIRAYEPDMTGLVVLALISDQAECCGCLISRQLTGSTAEIQYILDPAYKDRKDTVALGKMAADYVLGSTSKLIGTVPTPDKELLRYFQRVGFTREGVNRKSFMRNGVLLDQYYVGKSRE